MFSYIILSKLVFQSHLSSWQGKWRHLYLMCLHNVTEWCFHLPTGQCWEKIWAMTTSQWSIWAWLTFTLMMPTWRNIAKWEQFCYCCDEGNMKLILSSVQVISLVESVHLSGLGHCGHYTTYSAFPDMDTEVWTCLKVQQLSFLLIYIIIHHTTEIKWMYFPGKFSVS